MMDQSPSFDEAYPFGETQISAQPRYPLPLPLPLHLANGFKSSSKHSSPSHATSPNKPIRNNRHSAISSVFSANSIRYYISIIT